MLAQIAGGNSKSDYRVNSGNSAAKSDSHEAWRGELAQRVQAYRAKRRKNSPNLAQCDLPFAEPEPQFEPAAAVAVEECATAEPRRGERGDFAFTIAIGRNAAAQDDSRIEIDVSSPAAVEEAVGIAPSVDDASGQTGLYPVASIEERRIAGLIDAGCLLFAYGAFLTLFGSLGGEFTLSKLSAAVCVATFVIVYLQYFALFTVFGGTTPGMMLRGLQVVSFSADGPTPRQMLRRSAGYMLSAGTLFMGFLWAMWDEDELTWHDRLSQTYLAPAPTFAEVDARHAAHTR